MAKEFRPLRALHLSRAVDSIVLNYPEDSRLESRAFG